MVESGEITASHASILNGRKVAEKFGEEDKEG
jgi:hypothetical protein